MYIYIYIYIVLEPLAADRDDLEGDVFALAVGVQPEGEVLGVLGQLLIIIIIIIIIISISSLLLSLLVSLSLSLS